MIVAIFINKSNKNNKTNIKKSINLQNNDEIYKPFCAFKYLKIFYLQILPF